MIYSYSPTYISLTPIIYENNCIDYVVSYFDSDVHLRLLYYQFDIDTKNNKLISEKIEVNFLDIVSGRYGYSSYNFKHQGLSCVYIEDYYYEKYYYENYFIFYKINQKKNLWATFEILLTISKIVQVK